MRAQVQTKVKHLHAPKIQETEKDYQDHFDLRVRPTTTLTVSAAIADGATDSAFAARWAQELTRLFVENPPINDEGELRTISEWLKPAQDAWHKSVPWDRVPWHGIDKARRGAVATFLGITVESVDDHQLKVRNIAIGDCELFIIDSLDQVKLTFPVTKASEFTNRPDLVCSNPTGNRDIDVQTKQITASICIQDTLILTTDAMAEWLLAEHTSPTSRRQISQMNDAEFAAWLQSERSCGRIKNDDTTIAFIEFESADPALS